MARGALPRPYAELPPGVAAGDGFGVGALVLDPRVAPRPRPGLAAGDHRLPGLQPRGRVGPGRVGRAHHPALLSRPDRPRLGALLRPAAVPHLVDDPVAIRDSYLSLDLPDLHTAVTAAMTSAEEDAVRRSRAVDASAHWLEENLPALDGEALLANAMADLIDGDPSVRQVEQAADRLGVSVRTLQRLARHYVGLPPAAMIRRRRLQEAAERLRREPGTDIAAVANDLGYADHAHLTTDFRNVLNFTPSAYRGTAIDQPGR